MEVENCKVALFALFTRQARRFVADKWGSMKLNTDTHCPHNNTIPACKVFKHDSYIRL